MNRSLLWIRETSGESDLLLLTDTAMYAGHADPSLIPDISSRLLAGDLDALPNDAVELGLHTLTHVTSIKRSHVVSCHTGYGAESVEYAVLMSSREARDELIEALSMRLNWPMSIDSKSPYKNIVFGASLLFLDAFISTHAYKTATATGPIPPSHGRGAYLVDFSRWIGRTLGSTGVVIVAVLVGLFALWVAIKPMIRPTRTIMLVPVAGSRPGPTAF